MKKLNLDKIFTPAQRKLLHNALIGEMEKLEEEEQDYIRLGNRQLTGKKRAQIEDCAILIQVLGEVQG